MNKEEIKNLIKDLIEKTTVKVESLSIFEDSPQNTWFQVKTNEPHFFIEHDGEALRALNHIVRRIVENKMNPKFIPGVENKEISGMLIDINDFQKKRVDGVRAVAHMMSERARYFKSSIEIDPMSSFERRIVHEFLSEAKDLKTESIGLGPNRRVVIKYVGEI